MEQIFLTKIMINSILDHIEKELEISDAYQISFNLIE